MTRISDIVKLINTYAPQLDEEDKIKFGMFIHNQYASEQNLDDLNLATEWKEYKK